MTLLILTVGAYVVMSTTSFTIGMLVAFQMFASRLSQPLMHLVGLWQQFQQASLSVKRLGDIMNAPTEPYSTLPSRLTEQKGLIEIEGLAFRHSEHHPYLYQNLNITVNPGSMVAIMGASGSGKSTLAKLLQGFYQASDGRIKLDGTDIHNLSANELRQYFGVVPQETILFSGTIYDNLLSANPLATFERIVHAAKLAEIHDAIEKLPNGYQTEIGERGSGLSGGQRQRLAIARALLKQPKILIFDEATSALDPQTAEHFAHTVNQLRVWQELRLWQDLNQNGTQETGELKSLAELGVSELGYGMATYTQNGAKKQLASPDLLAKKEGQNISVTENGILIQKSEDGSFSLLVTRIVPNTSGAAIH